jgi:putative ABC transport system ATP-binding protein
MTLTPLLHMKNVSKHFTLPSGQCLQVLENIDLTIVPGEVVAIVGRSGSGKSTLLNLLGLLDRPSSGTFHCQGVDVAKMRDAQMSRLRGAFLGFIFQQYHLMDRRTALENVAEPLLYGSARDLRGRSERAAPLLEQVGLAERAHSMPHLLSGGEQQRVAIARALVRKPQVVLADEPTGSLDATTGEMVLRLLLNLVRAEGTSLILVTHDAAIADHADRILSLYGGCLHEAVVQ